MKRLLAVLLISVMMFSLAACSGAGEKETEPSTSTTNALSSNNDTNQSTNSAKNLVVYFSMPDDVDDSTVTINGETLGNTQYMASVIQDNANADTFRIVPKTPYPTNHQELVDLAKEEQNNNVRPEIEGTIENFDSYDTVFVGYPNWWGDMPMILYTFFDAYDFSGKTIIPFNTHGGSGFSSTINTIKELEPKADVKDGLSISRDVIQDAQQEIIDWLKELGFAENTETATSSKNADTSNVALQEDNNSPVAEKNIKLDEEKTIVAYFSWSGNTKEMAQTIADQTNGDLFEIVPVNAYPSDYTECTEVALKERNENARPQIKDLPENLHEYDRVFIGYPIWWHTAPMIIGTFLENYDLSGIDVYPFAQSASMNKEQFDDSMTFVRESGGNGYIHDGLFAKSSDSSAITEYISQISQ